MPHLHLITPGIPHPAEVSSSTSLIPKINMASLKWVTYSGGPQPANLVEAGYRGNGSKTYVARGEIGGELAIGKFQNGTSYIPWNGKENNVSPCELLVCDKPDELLWIPASNGEVPNGAIDGGHRQDGLPFYVGHAKHESEMLPGRVFPLDKCIYVGTGWKVYRKSEYEVLVAKSYVLPTEK
ncbi:hypothetical protein BWQ96_06853 [Gracilariopsis chorda]|uniref:Natterin-3 n=2 Tax=Gracilariopsis chorda TaxID=448386 RepID=A0A2V3IMX1_9FLOR|nr:hypothetical protein BWQ96_06853 [Gracilariopsis chorda]|eukprot:PXF43407.1 hypothetical protein BWQ96_06853 [Gracilariopsis chorda]